MFMALMLLSLTPISKALISVLSSNDRLYAIDQTSCPGSAMFLFRFPNGKLILHTGDFRAAPELLANPLLQPNQIDTIYLDTTYVDRVCEGEIHNTVLLSRYCDAQYRFPSQTEVIQSTVELVLEALKTNPRTLIAVGTYLIGKERIFHGTNLI